MPQMLIFRQVLEVYLVQDEPDEMQLHVQCRAGTLNAQAMGMLKIQVKKALAGSIQRRRRS
jgi:hypothetical protein